MPALTIHPGGGQVNDLHHAVGELRDAWTDLTVAIAQRLEGRESQVDTQDYLDRVQGATRHANALVDRALRKGGE
jgi:hypothetical protein